MWWLLLLTASLLSALCKALWDPAFSSLSLVALRFLPLDPLKLLSPGCFASASSLTGTGIRNPLKLLSSGCFASAFSSWESFPPPCLAYPSLCPFGFPFPSSSHHSASASGKHLWILSSRTSPAPALHYCRHHLSLRHIPLLSCAALAQRNPEPPRPSLQRSRLRLPPPHCLQWHGRHHRPSHSLRIPPNLFHQRSRRPPQAPLRFPLPPCKNRECITNVKCTLTHTCIHTDIHTFIRTYAHLAGA